MTSGTPTQPQYNSLYQGTVVNTNDPTNSGLVQLQIPQVLGSSVSGWASPMQPGIVPAVGTAVLVTFLGGDPNQPYYFLGVTDTLLQSVSTGSGTVLNLNPFFTGLILDPWTATGATLTAVTPSVSENPPFTYGALMQATGTSGMTLQDDAFPVLPGQPYQVSAWLFLPSTGPLDLGMVFLDSSGSPITGAFTQTFTLPGASWTLEQAVITSPPNAVTGYPVVIQEVTTLGDQLTAEAVTVLGSIPGGLITPSSITTTQVGFTSSDIGGIQVNIQALAPTNPNIGDLWFDTGTGMALMQYTSTGWQPYQFGSGAIQTGAIVAGLIAAGAIDGMVINGITINGNTINAADILISATNGGIFVYSQGGGANQVLTSGTSWTCPAGITELTTVVAIGAGGGGSYVAGGLGCGGGGGGSTIATNVTVVPGTAYAISLGTGGSAGTSSLAPGAGTNTVATFGSTVVTGNAGASGSGSGSSITHVGSYAATASSGTCSVTIPSSTVNANDVIVVSTMSNGTHVTNGQSVKDSVNTTTFTKVLEQLDTGAAYLQTHIYQTPLAFTTGATITLTGYSGASDTALAVDVFRGASVNIDRAAQGQDNTSISTSGPAPALASDASAGALVITSIGTDLAGSLTKGSGFTAGGNTSAGPYCVAQGYVLSASGSSTYSSTWTIGSGGHDSATETFSLLTSAGSSAGAGGAAGTGGYAGGSGAQGSSGSGGSGSASYTTHGTYSWLCPAGVYSIKALPIGAGGGGGGTPVGSNYAGTGGGGGGSAYGTISVTPGTYYTIVVGEGGAGGDSSLGSSGYPGSAGGSSTAFGLTGAGGGGGDIYSTVGSGGSAGSGGFAGGNGGTSGVSPSGPSAPDSGGGGGGSGGSTGAGGTGGAGGYYGAAGSGGAAGAGSGGAGGAGGSDAGGYGSTGASPGGGGGGAGQNGSAYGNGGTGADGGVFITWQTSSPKGGGGGSSAGTGSAGNNGAVEQGGAAVTGGGPGGGTLSGGVWTAAPTSGTYGGGGGGNDPAGAAGAGAAGKILLSWAGGTTVPELLFSVCGAPTPDPLSDTPCPEGPCLWQNQLITFAGNAFLNGVATTGSSTGLTQTGAGWTASQWIGYTATITGGTGAGSTAVITANTTTAITVASWSGTAPGVGSTYVIVENAHGSISAPAARELQLAAPKSKSTDVQASLILSSVATGSVPTLNHGAAILTNVNELDLNNETVPAAPASGAKVYANSGILYANTPGGTAVQLAPAAGGGGGSGAGTVTPLLAGPASSTITSSTTLGSFTAAASTWYSVEGLLFINVGLTASVGLEWSGSVSTVGLYYYANGQIATPADYQYAEQYWVTSFTTTTVGASGVGNDIVVRINGGFEASSAGTISFIGTVTANDWETFGGSYLNVTQL